MQNPAAVDTIITDQSTLLGEMEFIGEQLYGVDFQNNFYRVNINTGAIDSISTLDLGEGDFVSPADLSFVPSMVKLYVTSSQGDIFELDWGTGATQLVASTGLENIFAAAIDNSGTMYGVRFGEIGLEFFTVAIPSGEVTPFISSDRRDLGFLGLEIDPSTDKIYAINSLGIRNGNSGFSYLEYSEIDKATFLPTQRYYEIEDFKRPSAFAFQAVTPPSYQYSWAAATGITDPSLATQTVMVTETSSYPVWVTDACGTSVQTMISVNLVDNITTQIDTVIEIGMDYNGTVITEETVLLESYITANGCDSTVIVNVSTPIISSIESWPKKAIQISPNPTSDFLDLETINLNATDVRVYVRDIYGRSLMELPLNSNAMQINLSGIDKGYYFLEIRSRDKFAVRRFIKL